MALAGTVRQAAMFPRAGTQREEQAMGISESDVNSIPRHKRRKSRGASRKMWSYKGIDVYPADLNSSGCRWYARVDFGPVPVLRADSKERMRDLINNARAS
jgi:hypothetical protein